MRRVLLDTNAYSALIRGDTEIQKVIDKAQSVYVSVFVLGELYAGFQGGSKQKENVALLDSFLKQATVQILPATIDTAEIFGLVKQNLKKQGTPIPINDVWIAAHTLEIGATLISYDAHFSLIPNLMIWNG